MRSKPTDKQTALLLMNDYLEVLYGGAAGGGKSEGHLMLAAQYVDVPGYAALLLRRTYRDLALPGALMDRSHKWWGPTSASWDAQNYTWRFPSGASITFGYLEKENDHLRYQSAEFQFIGFDELTQFLEHQYTYMFSRIRRLEGFPVPLRMRGATNPGGPGHEWVKRRFGLPAGPDPVATPERKFLFANLDDNPYLDREEYEKAFEQLSSVTRAQLRKGDWSAQSSGGRFDPANFTVIPWRDVPPPKDFASVVRYWDLAATAPNEEDPDPDWTVGMKMGMTRRGVRGPESDYYILDIARFRKDAGDVEYEVARVAGNDGTGTPQWFEQERGGAGKLLVATYNNNVLPNHVVMPLYVTGDKATRAKLPAGLSKKGHIYIAEADYVDAFHDEVGLFGIDGVHDDQVDALSGGVVVLPRARDMLGIGAVGQW